MSPSCAALNEMNCPEVTFIGKKDQPDFAWRT
jgi:hypothetical protein